MKIFDQANRPNQVGCAKVSDEHLAGISPMLQKHVIVNGMYDFSRWQHTPMQVQ